MDIDMDMIDFVVNCVPKTRLCQHNSLQNFKTRIRFAAKQTYPKLPLDGPLSLELYYIMPRPKRLVWKNRLMPRQWHYVKPRLDDLEEAVIDALTGLIWRDSAQICRKLAAKQVASGAEQPYVRVIVNQIEEIKIAT